MERESEVEDSPSDAARARWIPVVIAGVAVIAILAPMFRSPAPDSFPLSTYPMFARDRGDATWLDTVIGRTGGGDVIRLSPHLISGSDEPVLASATVSRAIDGRTFGALCERVASSVADDGPDAATTIEVVSERHDLDRFTPDDPIERRIHATCAVPS